MLQNYKKYDIICQTIGVRYMDFNKMLITDMGLFSKRDVCVRYFNNNGIETVGSLLLTDVADLVVNKGTSKEILNYLNTIIDLAKCKFLGVPMGATSMLDEVFESGDYSFSRKKESQIISSSYFKRFGIGPEDSSFMYNYIRSRNGDGKKIIDCFKMVYSDSLIFGDCCLNNILELYISDYEAHKKEKKNKEYIKVDVTSS